MGFYDGKGIYRDSRDSGFYDGRGIYRDSRDSGYYDGNGVYRDSRDIGYYDGNGVYRDSRDNGAYDGRGTYRQSGDFSGSGSSGCFLTTACVDVLGKEDDCYELQTLREYRDTYLKAVCPDDIKEYYEIAPAIVSKMKEQDNYKELFIRLYKEMIMPCIKRIEEKDYEGAHRLYKEGTLKLKETYIDL